MIAPSLKAALDALAKTKGLAPPDEILASGKQFCPPSAQAVDRPLEWRLQGRTNSTDKKPWWADGK